MQPVGERELKHIIKKAKEAGKDVSELEKKAKVMKEAVFPKGETKKKITEKGTIVIKSTGPAREEDFEWLKWT